MVCPLVRQQRLNYLQTKSADKFTKQGELDWAVVILDVDLPACCPLWWWWNNFWEADVKTGTQTDITTLPEGVWYITSHIRRRSSLGTKRRVRVVQGGYKGWFLAWRKGWLSNAHGEVRLVEISMQTGGSHVSRITQAMKTSESDKAAKTEILLSFTIRLFWEDMLSCFFMSYRRSLATRSCFCYKIRYFWT